MTLNGVIALILRFFSPDSTALQADYVTVAEDTYNVRKILPPIPVFHFWPKLTHPAAFLCAIAELLVNPRMIKKIIMYCLSKLPNNSTFFFQLK